jgi:glyoxylase-like metal-dependent hydrolase (beta-lactamase superfamily II)
MERALQAQGLTSSELQVCYNCLMIDTGAQRVLIDTGCGANADAKADAEDPAGATGLLLPRLQAAGILADEIDFVVLTHGHLDHVGGTTTSPQSPAFPNARYVLAKEEWEFWMAEPVPIADELYGLVTAARDHLLPIRDRIDLVRDGAQIAPGVWALAAPGHTPGHLAVAITSAGERLLCLADTLYHPIQLAYPDWFTPFDSAPTQAIASRHRLLARAADERWLVQAYHLPFPGVGHIVRDTNAYHWRPLVTVSGGD